MAEPAVHRPQAANWQGPVVVGRRKVRQLQMKEQSGIMPKTMLRLVVESGNVRVVSAFTPCTASTASRNGSGKS